MEERDREHEITQQLTGRYELIELIGRGGFAAVYRVMNVRLHRTEALKVLSERLTEDQDFARRFEQEARTAASLDHPNIVKIYDYGGLENFFWFSMQLVDGPSLGRRLKSGSRLEPFTAARIGVRILDALRYSHERGVIHRDIKPDNILIDREGRPYLTDYGVAKSQLALVKTQAGTLLGSPAYMSPEQLQGKPVDPRSDLYSVGVTLYKGLAGELPFSGEDTFRATMKRLSEPPKPLSQVLPGIDPFLEEIVMRSLEKEPDQRFADAADFCSALEEFLAGAPAQPQPIPMPGAGDATLVLTPTRGSRSGSSRTPTLTRRPSSATAPRRPTATPVPTPPPPVLPEMQQTAPLPPVRRNRMPLVLGGLGAAVLVLAAVLLATRRRGPEPVPEAPAASVPTAQPAAAPTAVPTEAPTAAPAAVPAEEPTPMPTPEPTLPPRRSAASTPRRAAPTQAPDSAPANLMPARAARIPPEAVQTAPLELAPEIAARHRGESVGLIVTVGEDGNVKKANVISEVCPECDRAAVEAVKKFKFKPARDADGRPVEATIAIPIRL
jgi:serine/threonine-protein kinase